MRMPDRTIHLNGAPNQLVNYTQIAENVNYLFFSKKIWICDRIFIKLLIMQGGVNDYQS